MTALQLQIVLATQDTRMSMKKTVKVSYFSKVIKKQLATEKLKMIVVQYTVYILLQAPVIYWGTVLP